MHTDTWKENYQVGNLGKFFQFGGVENEVKYEAECGSAHMATSSTLVPTTSGLAAYVWESKYILTGS